MEHVPQHSPQEISLVHEYLDLDESILYEKLGEVSQEYGYIPDLISAGAEKFRTVVQNYKESICKNEKIKHLWNTDEGDRHIDLVFAIADMIAQTQGKLIIGELFVREGVNILCREYWMDERK
jgi:hypothetical protein